MIAPSDLAVCQAALRRGSRSFAGAARLLPKPLQGPVTALYAFCRAADDEVDEGEGAAALPRLRARLAAAYAGRPACAVDRAFAATVSAYGIPRALPESLLEGFSWDAEGRRYDSPEALREYALRVAGSVGVMMALLMGEPAAPMLELAAELGCAMQFTNIARDVGEDAACGRIYLPLGWLAEAGIDAGDWLAAPCFSPALGEVVARLLDLAESMYARADAGIAQLPAACQPAIRLARLSYAGLHGVIRRQEFNTLSCRARLPRARRLLLLAQACGARRAESIERGPQARPLARSSILCG